MKIRKLNKKEWNLLIFCIIILAVMLTEAALRQTYVKFNRLKGEISLTEAKFARLNRILSQRQEIESEYSKAIVGLRRIKTSDDFLREIEGFAKRVGLNISNIKPVSIEEEGFYKLYSVRLEAQDDIPALAKFLHTFTDDFKGIGIKRLQIKTQDRNKLPKIDLLINAVAFKE